MSHFESEISKASELKCKLTEKDINNSKNHKNNHQVEMNLFASYSHDLLDLMSQVFSRVGPVCRRKRRAFDSG
jgi:hypothetical protein